MSGPVKADINQAGREASDFPIVCATWYVFVLVSRYSV